MVIYVVSKKIALGASVSESDLYRKTVEDNFSYIIHEIGFVIPDDGKIDGYIDEVRLDDVKGKAYPSVDERAVVERELVSGQEIVYKATSVTAGDFAILLIYDKIPK